MMEKQDWKVVAGVYVEEDLSANSSDPSTSSPLLSRFFPRSRLFARLRWLCRHPAPSTARAPPTSNSSAPSTSNSSAPSTSRSSAASSSNASVLPAVSTFSGEGQKVLKAGFAVWFLAKLSDSIYRLRLLLSRWPFVVDAVVFPVLLVFILTSILKRRRRRVISRRVLHEFIGLKMAGRPNHAF